MYSFKPKYHISWDKEPEGRMTGDLNIDIGNPDLWALVPLMLSGNNGDNEYVMSGHHYVPVFKSAEQQKCLRAIQLKGFTVETLKVELICF